MGSSAKMKLPFFTNAAVFRMLGRQIRELINTVKYQNRYFNFVNSVVNFINILRTIFVPIFAEITKLKQE